MGERKYPDAAVDAAMFEIAAYLAATSEPDPRALAVIALSAAEPHLTVTKSSRSSAKPTDQAFEAFWKAYPRHTAKEAARKAYEAAVASVGHQVVLEGAERFAASLPATQDPKYIPHPATWLNQKRWEDEPDPPRRNPVADGNRAHWRSGKGFGIPEILGGN